MSVTNAQRFMALFAGLPRAYGIYDLSEATRSAKGKLEGKGATLQQDVTEELWQRHLDGKIQLGIIPIRDDATAVFGVIDVDDYKLDHLALEKKIQRKKFPLVMVRSKSGGAHLYLFLKKPMPAEALREILTDYAATLGYAHIEIFPKQNKLASLSDTGNWINMPYCGGDTSDRHGLVAGQKQTMEPFFALAKASASDPKAIVRPVEDETPEILEGAPPCLVTLTSEQVRENRNSTLFNLGVYARKSHPDDWQEWLKEYNAKFISPPLDGQEVGQIIDHLEKREYQYGCKNAPLVGVCQSKLCLKRKYGIGELKNAIPPAQALIECVADVKEVPLEFLTHGGIPIPLGKLTLFAGDPGVSKSTMTCDLAAAVTLGRNGGPYGEVIEGEVLMLSAEDDVADTLRPRLRVAGAALKKVHAMTAMRDYDDKGNPIERSFDIARDAGRMAEALRDRGGRIRLIVIDPISAYMLGVDSHVNADVRGALKPLADLATAERVAVVLISHLNKGTSGNLNVLYRVTGSLAFVAACRATYAVARDPEDRERRMVLELKVNLTKETGQGFAYRLVDESGVPRIKWEAEAIEITADEVFNSNKEKADSEVEDWLRELLATGQKPATKVFELAKERKFSDNRVKRVKKSLGIHSFKEQREDGLSVWYWMLPVANADPQRRPQASPADWQFMNALASVFVDESGPLGLRAAGELGDLCARRKVDVPGKPEDPVPMRIGGVMFRCFGTRNELKLDCATREGPREVKARRDGGKGSYRYEFYEGTEPPAPVPGAM